ncbi:MAG: DUF2202 domain-containing protein [Ilumatobacteraceae bacterium]
MRSSREVDIQDLRDRQSGIADIDAMYDRLEAGSENHLRAFVRNLDQRGVEYDPKYSTPPTSRAILADAGTHGSDDHANGDPAGGGMSSGGQGAGHGSASTDTTTG